MRLKQLSRTALTQIDSAPRSRQYSSSQSPPMIAASFTKGRRRAVDQPESEFHTGGGAGLFSTAPDYVTFTRMLLAGGALDGVEVLKPETVKLMSRNAIGDLNVPIVRSNNPALALEVETFPGQIKKWGLSFLINTEDIEGFRSAGSLTWGGVHNTYFWIDLKKRITVVALMQILPIGDPIVQETMIAFERALYAAIA